MLSRCRPIGGSLLALLPALGCGSGASNGQTTSDPLQRLCVSICTVAYQCADAGKLTSTCSVDCADASLQSADGGPPPSGCNVNQFVSAETACLQTSCSTFGACIGQATTSSGCATSGSTSSGSISDGSTSGSSTSGCALCDQAGSCCSALAAEVGPSDAGDCSAFTTTGCNGSNDPSGFASNCQQELTIGQDFSLAACSH